MSAYPEVDITAGEAAGAPGDGDDSAPVAAATTRATEQKNEQCRSQFRGQPAPAIAPVNKWLITITVMFGAFMAVMDVSVVNVSLPHMMGTFGAGSCPPSPGWPPATALRRSSWSPWPAGGVRLSGESGSTLCVLRRVHLRLRPLRHGHHLPPDDHLPGDSGHWRRGTDPGLPGHPAGNPPPRKNRAWPWPSTAWAWCWRRPWAPFSAAG